MQREIHKWFSPNLNKEMETVVYGTGNQYALLMFPTAAADYLEYERFHLIESMTPYINNGKVRAISINSINSESWLNDENHPEYKSERHKQFNEYVINEVVPFIKQICGNDVQIITTGASFGALHAANTFFRRPDVFAGTIAMSGSYDLKDYSKGYYDENVYFNSPVDYLSNFRVANPSVAQVIHAVRRVSEKKVHRLACKHRKHVEAVSMIDGDPVAVVVRLDHATSFSKNRLLARAAHDRLVTVHEPEERRSSTSLALRHRFLHRLERGQKAAPLLCDDVPRAALKRGRRETQAARRAELRHG